MKKYQKIWTEKVFVIDDIVYGNPIIYKTKNQDNEAIKGTFQVEELQLIVEAKTYHIEKVIQNKKEGNHVFLYVKVTQLN